MAEPAIRRIHLHEDGASCGRCGSTAEWLSCWYCGGDVWVDHDCGEDCCACLYPEPNVTCAWCGGGGGSWHCISTPEWCEAHPMAGRENVKSTALTARAWEDA